MGQLDPETTGPCYTYCGAQGTLLNATWSPDARGFEGEWTRVYASLYRVKGGPLYWPPADALL